MNESHHDTCDTCGALCLLPTPRAPGQLIECEDCWAAQEDA